MQLLSRADRLVLIALLHQIGNLGHLHGQLLSRGP